MRYRFNPFVNPTAKFEPAGPAVLEFQASLTGYRPTPFHALPALASSLGLRNVYAKDESHRFGLDAFKVLGASWAIHRVLARNGACGRTFACATDGSHGRAVAWAARRAGAKAVVYVPHSMPVVRREAIREEGAEVVVVDGLYDDGESADVFRQLRGDDRDGHNGCRAGLKSRISSSTAGL
jgi:diaminopropionate ammonia-lyase